MLPTLRTTAVEFIIPIQDSRNRAYLPYSDKCPRKLFILAHLLMWNYVTINKIIVNITQKMKQILLTNSFARRRGGRYSVSEWPGVNFINVLRAQFSYKILVPKITKLKHLTLRLFGERILAKNARLKCWWNRHQCRIKLFYWRSCLSHCHNKSPIYLTSKIILASCYSYLYNCYTQIWLLKCPCQDKVMKKYVWGHSNNTWHIFWSTPPWPPSLTFPKKQAFYWLLVWKNVIFHLKKGKLLFEKRTKKCYMALWLASFTSP